MSKWSTQKMPQNVCKRCVRDAHSWKFCPAREAECRQCKKKGHFTPMCWTGKRVETIVEGDLPDEELVLMGEINTERKAEKSIYFQLLMSL